ncbi:MAG: tripartite tricarboxylate transporter substrate-binding protein [Chloroflexota bacterium]|nr:tripartite tricarboxylate transporter substrate-binding protein [Chloroflexota bacterium]
MEALTKEEVLFGWESFSSLAAARDGLFRIIGMGTAQRHPLYPDVMTMQEAGLIGFSAFTWNVTLGPRGMPAEVVEKLNAAANQVLAMPDVKMRLATTGINVVSDSTPATNGTFTAEEFTKFRDIITRARLDLAR